MILYALPLPQEQVHLIHNYALQHRTPVIAVHSVGFYSYFKVTLPGTFPIVDTHPDEAATTDLRLLTPWPELSDFSKEMTKDINSLDNHEHGHLPLVVILLHYLDIWQQSHDGRYPTTYAEKTAFRKTISDATRRNNPEGGEENFEEAVAAVMKHIVVPSIPSSLQQVFDYEHQDSVRSTHVSDHDAGSLIAIERDQVRILDNFRSSEAILPEEWTTTSSWWLTRHEGSVSGVHQASEHLQGKGPSRCERSPGTCS